MGECGKWVEGHKSQNNLLTEIRIAFKRSKNNLVYHDSLATRSASPAPFAASSSRIW